MNKRVLSIILISVAIVLIGTIMFCVSNEVNTMNNTYESENVEITVEDIEPTETTVTATESPVIEEPVEITVPVVEETEAVTEPAKPEPTDPPEWEYNDELSAKENIFIYLTDYLGFPEPAACGIISNIAHETGWKFNPRAGSLSRSYGLIQWTGGRLSKLKKWCKKHGKDYNSIQGQLDFMYWELTKDDPYGTYDYLMECTDGKSAAYDAGWYFCFWYERPANTHARARLRGSDAKDYYEELVLDK